MIRQALSNSYKREILMGVHQDLDIYKVALYTAAARLSKATTQYTTEHEAAGDGYVAGGRILNGITVALKGDTAYIDWDDPEWPLVTITARGALIYNQTRGQRAVMVLDFGKDIRSTNGPFRITLPSPTPSTALLRVT